MIGVSPSAPPVSYPAAQMPSQNILRVIFVRRLACIKYEPITVKDLKVSNVQLLCIDRDENNELPPFVAVGEKTGGTAPGAIYRSGHQSQLWLGKRGRHPRGSVDPSRYGSILKSMNLEVMQEKLANDFYQELGHGLFVVPKTLLSRQKIADGFHDELNAKELEKNWGIKETLRIMSQFVDGYQDFNKAETQDLEGKLIPFMVFIRRYRCPPKGILTPQKTLVPLRGFMEMVAVGRALADIDMLGKNGENAGFVWDQDQNGIIVAAKTVKIDPGEALKFEIEDEKKVKHKRERPFNPCDIQIEQSGVSEISIRWNSLSKDQKEIFLSTLINCLRYKNNKRVLKFLFVREKKFRLSDTEEIPLEVAKDLVNQMKTWLEEEEKIFAHPLEQYYRDHPEEVIRVQYIDHWDKILLPVSEEKFPIRELFTHLALVEHQEQKEQEQQLREQEKEKKLADEGFKARSELLERDSFLEAQDRLQSASQPICLEDLFISSPPSREKKQIRKVLLLGSAGVGKSTLCRKIAHDWACGRLWEYTAIYWLPLRECNAAMEVGFLDNPIAWLALALSRLVLKKTDLSESLEKHIKENWTKILIIFDGYDEASPELTRMIDHILSIPDLNILLTSRPGMTTSRHKPGMIEALHHRMDRVVQNMGFLDSQVETYVDLFFARERKGISLAKSLKADFMAALKSRPSFLAMAHIPLYLRFLCVLWERGRGFPSTITQLYQETIEQLFIYQCRREGKELQSIDPRERKTLFLCLAQVAFHRLESQKLLISEGEIDRICMICTKNCPDFPVKKEQLLSSGLLKATSDEKEYYFLHLTLQKYLIAWNISQSLEAQRKFVIEHREKPHFQLVMTFLAGLLYQAFISDPSALSFLAGPRIISEKLYNEAATKFETLANFFASLHCEGADILRMQQYELVASCLNECPNESIHQLVKDKYGFKRPVFDQTSSDISQSKKFTLVKNQEVQKAADQGNAAAQINLGACYYEGRGVPQSYTEAVKWYQKAADQGNDVAQNRLAVCYYKGHGVPQSYAEAAKWCQKAADQGNDVAQINLGGCYYEGRGVPQSYTEAVKWYQKAADQGNDVAQNSLGNCYYKSHGVPQSYAEAVKWYQKAAEQGHSAAQCSLGFFYEKGQGVDQDPQKAIMWYQKAADQGHIAAQDRLGDCYYEGYGVPQSYPGAVKWYQKAAEQGNASAQTSLAVCYYKGHGVPQSYAEAAKWCQKAAEQGHSDAQDKLGDCYYEGYGVPQSYPGAVKWYQKAAEQGNASAQTSLAVCYYKGHGVPQSYTEAVKWYQKAADQGNDVAQNSLAVCYYKGHGVPQSYAEAVKWYQKAADKEFDIAQVKLAHCYRVGRGVDQDDKKAATWYQKAAEQGNAAAQTRLGNCYYEGRGVPQSYTEAVKWYQKATDQGNADAKSRLGSCYEKSREVAQDDQKAAERGLTSP